MSAREIVLPVIIEEHEEGGYLAVCGQIQGCHAGGDTVEEAVENIVEVAEMTWELCAQENLPMPRILESYSPGISISALVTVE